MDLAQGRGEVTQLLMSVSQANGTQLKEVMCYLIGILHDRGVITATDVAVMLVRSNPDTQEIPLGLVFQQPDPDPTPLPQVLAMLDSIPAEATQAEPPPQPLSPYKDPSPLLTPKQYAVLLELAKGRPTKVIARTLNVSGPTIKTHLGCIYHKLGAHNAMQAVNNAIKRGIISPRDFA